MSYHNTSTSSRSTTSTSTATPTVVRSVTNAQGQTAPAGYHYMPNGVLMADSAHVNYENARVIKNFELDTSNIKTAGEIRNIKIFGDNGAEFSLEIRSGTNYYNFENNLFQTTPIKLAKMSITGGVYRKDIRFPNKIITDTVNGAVTGGINIVMDTAVASTMKVGDRVTGNAALDAANITVAALDPDGDNTNEFSLSQAIAVSDEEILSFAGADQYDIYLIAGEKTKHSQYNEVRLADGSIDINLTTGSNSNIIRKVIYQTLDVVLYLSGLSPTATVNATSTSAAFPVSRGGGFVEIPFEIVSTVSNSNVTLQINGQPSSNDLITFVQPDIGGAPVTIPGENIYPTITTAANSTTDGGTTVNGSSTGTTVTTHVVSSTIATFGDRVLGNAALAAKTVTVTAISGGSGKTFTISEAISIEDDLPLTFSNQRNYRWPISSTTFDVSKLTSGMTVNGGVQLDGVATIKDYVELGSLVENKYIPKVKIPAVKTFGVKPIVVINPITKVATTTVGNASNPVNITFSKQALRALAGGSVKIYAYGMSEVYRLTGWDVEVSNLTVTGSTTSTTTTAAVNSSTSVPIAQRAGITDEISTVSGLGINPNVIAPTVASGAGAVSGAGTIVLTEAQTLESGVALTFPGVSESITIAGRVKVNFAGNEDVILRFDLEKFITMH